MNKVFGRALVACALLAALATASCASAAGGERMRTRSDIITRAEIEGLSSAATLYDVVNQLRPRWLQVRASRSLSMETEILVFQGSILLGGTNVLRQFAPDVAWSLQYLDGATASASLPGLSGRHLEGAILLITAPPERDEGGSR